MEINFSLSGAHRRQMKIHSFFQKLYQFLFKQNGIYRSTGSQTTHFFPKIALNVKYNPTG